MHTAPSVLIVDRSEETREVLETALRRRGIRTFSASRVANGAAMASFHRPDLIVLDLELDRNSPDTLCSRFSDDSGPAGPPMVLLGAMRRSTPNPSGEIIPKPYHYGPLVRRIEEILGTVDRDSRYVA